MKLLPKIFLPLEIISVLATIFGVFLRLQHLNGGAEILMLGLSALSALYFLKAFIPVNAPARKEDAPVDTLALLGGTIAPKVTMISCAVTLVGCLFSILHLHGGGEQLLIGLSALGIGTLLCIICLLRDQSNYGYLTGFVIRGVPVFFFGLYLLMNKPA